MQRSKNTRLREIPYNYTSFTDKEIVLRLLGEESWSLINKLRHSRRTGISAKMIFEILGDIWIFFRNPYLQDDLFNNVKRWKALTKALHHRLDQVFARANENEEAVKLSETMRTSLHDFENWFPLQQTLRAKTVNILKKVTRKDNIHFDGLSRVSHASDASDWRVKLPFVVISPDTELETQKIVKACIKLGLSIIPRGGGTGYTGSSVPLNENTAVINLEKLDQLGEMEFELDENSEKMATVHTATGVVTKRVSEVAEKNKYVFAVDPTSQTASTIGGNIAMNAGGKKAVLWGTTLDNLLSWKMVTPDGNWIRIDRKNHNRGKIHNQESVRFEIHDLEDDGKTTKGDPQILNIKGSKFRKEGLGKDVTDKFLSGLPGVQKEGCDGIVTSAKFILHKMPKYTYTFCLEFFGHDLNKSVPAIVETIKHIEKNNEVQLAGLEHLDKRYITAIKYNTKASRRELPNMVLLGDITSDNEKALEKVIQKIKVLAKSREAECFVAITPQSRRNFWQDRSRTAAIAAHTNAFKINEDVVIPLEKLTQYNEGIETINIEYSIKNKLEIVNSLISYLKGPMPEIMETRNYESSSERQKIISSKRKTALKDLNTVKLKWTEILKNLENPAQKYSKLLSKDDKLNIKKGDKLKDLFLRREIRISYRKEVKTFLQDIFIGSELLAVRQKLSDIHAGLKVGRLFIATHMHAGDGNVHTNIPVNSNNYNMMQSAHEIVNRVMKLATSLGGVISGEHGIGITKFQFLDKVDKDNFKNYKRKIDPNNIFNPGKLIDETGLDSAYTPSLNLLQQEAIIMEQSEFLDLNNAIKHCLRCGKCKPVCTTHVPRANLLYAPRNKILGTGALIEAFLYEEQTRRGLSVQHFDEFNDIADHCTVCHNCYNPCPVNIDFGDVSVRMRNILRNQKQKKKNITADLSLAFLNITTSWKIHFLRTMIFRPAFFSQRQAYRILKKMPILLGRKNAQKIPLSTTGKMTFNDHLYNSLKKPLPSLPKENFRSVLSIQDPKYITILRDPKKTDDSSETVFFFPGCGIERLYTEPGFAALAMLYDLGVQVVLPPIYTCCGFPQEASGHLQMSKKIATDNRVLFHRVANTLNYLDIKTVVAICGTCIDQLVSYEFENIFPGSQLTDIHEFLLKKNIKLDGKQKENYIYHDPCHTPIKSNEPIEVINKIIGKKAVLSDRCCAESGLFAVSRPDISTQARFSKEEVLRDNVKFLVGNEKANSDEVKLLTTCPSCIQGLSRYVPDTGLTPKYLVTEVIEKRQGLNWKKQFIKEVKKNGIEKILL